jgi:hypothetical protein
VENFSAGTNHLLYYALKIFLMSKIEILSLVLFTGICFSIRSSLSTFEHTIDL